ncbi:MAG TPA: Por secretion system protein, partial [Bacteroidales bacterium]|nr:Por secretion system protein [Bacteroidales bacterium]
MKIYFTIISYFLFLANTFCQVIEVSPSLPTDVDAITLIFDASKASRTDLVDYSGDVYVHTGVNDWQYVIGNWGDNSIQPKLTRIGANTYTLSISPNIREFYGV